MPSEFGKAFDAWMEREGSELVRPALRRLLRSERREIVGELMKIAWFAGAAAADQQDLNRRKLRKYRPTRRLSEPTLGGPLVEGQSTPAGR